MGYELEAFLASASVLRRWKATLPAAVVCRLSGDLHLVPVTSALEQQLLAATHTTHAVHALRAWAETASREAPLVHMSGFEFGDQGSDVYNAWVGGEMVLRAASEPAVAAFFRERAGLTVPDGDFRIGRHRGESAAEKWAALALPEDPVEHRPVAEEEAHVLLIEPRGTPNTGDAATAQPRRVA